MMNSQIFSLEPQKPVLFLLSGMSGSGKTTLAAALSRAGIRRISIDELVFDKHRVYGKDYAQTDYFSYEAEARREARAQIVTALRDGFDAVYDHGLWSAEDREQMYALAAGAGALPVHVGFPVAREVIEKRLLERNKRSDANALQVSSEALDDFFARYVPPDENRMRIIDGTAPVSEVVREFR